MTSISHRAFFLSTVLASSLAFPMMAMAQTITVNDGDTEAISAGTGDPRVEFTGTGMGTGTVADGVDFGDAGGGHAVVNNAGAANRGTLTFAGDSVITGTVGIAGDGALAAVNINGTDGSVHFNESGTALTVSALNFGGTGNTVQLDGGLTGAIDFQGNENSIILGAGKNVTGGIDSTVASAGTVVINGNATLAGRLGGTNALNRLEINGGTTRLTGAGSGGPWHNVNTIYLANDATVQYEGNIADTVGDFITETDGAGQIVLHTAGHVNIRFHGNIGTEDKRLGLIENRSTTGTAIYAGGDEIWVDAIRLVNHDSNVFSLDGDDDITVNVHTIENDGVNHRGIVRIDSNATLVADTIGTDSSRMRQLLVRMGIAPVAGRTANISGEGYFQELVMPTNDTRLNLATADTVLTFTDQINLTGANPILGITVDGRNASKIVIDGAGNAVDLGSFSLNIMGPSGGATYIADGTGITIAEGQAAPILPGSVSSNLGTGYAFTAEADGNNIVLRTRRLSTFDGAASTPNNQSVGAALESIGHTGNAAISDLQNRLQAAIGTPQFDALLDTLAPAVDGSVAYTALNAANQSLGTVDTRLADLRDGGMTGIATGNGPVDRHMWAQGFGRLADQDSRNGVAGYDADTYGFAAGIDTDINDEETRVGAAASYAQTGIKSTGLYKSDIESYQLTLYGEHALDDRGTFVQGMAAYTHNENATTRFNVGGGGDAHGDYDSEQYTLQAKAGRAFAVPENDLTLTPHVLAHYMRFSPEDYTERQANGLGLTVDPDNMNVLELGGGIDAVWDIETGNNGVIQPRVSVDYRYDLVGDQAAATARFTGAAGPSFDTQGLEPGRHTLNLGAGLDYQIGAAWTFRAAYDFEYKAGFTAHSGQIRLGYKF
jgi:outer membrane autotransporter protein